MEDHEIISKIREGQREKALKVLYKEFPKIKHNIITSGGNTESAEEIFNDSLLLLIEKVSDPKFELTSKLSTYLYGIARLLWKNQLRKQNKTQELEWSDTLIISEQDIGYDHVQEEKFVAMERIISSLSAKCQEIFERFYFKKESMENLAAALGFSSVNSAKTQKYKCMEQAIRLAADHKPKK
ncbi:MAG: sigma-70 family RNA polymerase sigma factor [Bacteroidetes bacterium]|nr:sigma-70 family RNA polymerase sigma factor [Bacteroidota bacterium]